MVVRDPPFGFQEKRRCFGSFVPCLYLSHRKQGTLKRDWSRWAHTSYHLFDPSHFLGEFSFRRNRRFKIVWRFWRRDWQRWLSRRKFLVCRQLSGLCRKPLHNRVLAKPKLFWRARISGQGTGRPAWFRLRQKNRQPFWLAGPCVGTFRRENQ
jgi:hypothetical protein